MNAEPDILIIGGGMVGAALACALGGQARTVVVLERGPWPDFPPDSPPDLRVSAISLANEQALNRLGIWPRVPAERQTPYRRLATWEWLRTPWGHSLPPFQATRFTADEAGTDHLGAIVENRALQRAALEQASKTDGVTVLTDTAPEDMRFVQGRLEVRVNGCWWAPRLVVGADGALSRVRDAARIPLDAHPYDQWAMLINVTLAHPPGDETWQAFTPDGPRALLPLGSPDGVHRASLVWYDHPDAIRRWQQADGETLLHAIRAHFPPQLPALRAVEAVGAFPLVRRHAQRYWHGNTVLVGDAAHTIHPLAGQGVNLGFQDVLNLHAHLAPWLEGRTASPGSAPETYSRQRRAANLLMMRGMDVFYHGFSSRLPPLALARNVALALAHRAGPVKKQALKYALGLTAPFQPQQGSPT